MPEWDSVQTGSPFGINANISVTVDNGDTNFVNQIYQNADIIQLDVESGTYFNSWVTADILLTSTDLLVSYLSTDAFGIPLLDLTVPEDTRIQFQNAGGFWQFGTRDGSGPTTTWLEDEPNFNGFFAFHNSEEGFQVTGSSAAPIPEPATMLLLGTGLAGVAALKRRKKWNRV